MFGPRAVERHGRARQQPAAAFTNENRANLRQAVSEERNAGGPVSAQVLSKILVAARTSGHLKLGGRGLSALPEAAFDIGSVPLPEGAPWWETRETLETLDASDNSLTALPRAMASLVELRELNLAHNAIASVPDADCWRELAALVSVHLGHNKLAALPDGFGAANAPPLARLSVPHNALGTLPPSVSGLRDLVELDISHNALASLPAGLCGLVSLRKLNLSSNALDAFPADFVRSPPPNLVELLASANRLRGELALASASLTTLNLAKNKLGSLDVRECKALAELVASFNALATLPDVSPLASLATIDLSNNRISSGLLHLCGGGSPFRCGGSLTRVDLSCNELSEIPPQLGHLPLTVLALSGNPLRSLPSSVLTGPTPRLLAHLRGKLSDDDLAQSENAIPNGAGADARAGGARCAHESVSHLLQCNGTELAASAVGWTRFPPPDELPDALTRIDASGNQIGELPDGVCGALRRLASLDVSRNALRALPAELGAAGSPPLASLRASSNKLATLLPGMAAPLPSLVEVVVENNAIVELPAALWACPRLATLSLRANRLTAASLRMRADTVAARSALAELDLGENPLGSCPPLELCPELREVHLQRCAIPSLGAQTIATLASLQTLDVRDNDIGALPPQLSALPALASLGLSGNPLRSIPYSTQQRGTAAVLELLAKRMPA